MDFQYNNITVSGKIASGTTTLAKNLKELLGWKHINAGGIQRAYDREHHVNENKHGALMRSDKHEQEMDAMTKHMLSSEKGLIYEAWLAGFMAKGIPKVLKVLLYCSEDAIRIDRVVNRENISIDEAKQWIKQRETENIQKWKKLYGDYDFWDKKYYDIAIDTYGSGPMETVGIVLDKLGYRVKQK